jgi:hypothetical protein
MRFVLEEASWAWDGTDREGFIERMEQLLDRLDVARVRGEPYAVSRELLRQTIFAEYILDELMWNPSSPLALPFEVAQRFAAHFNAIRYWDDEEAWPAIEVTIAGRDVLSPSAALAHARVAVGTATACIPLPGVWRGPCEVVVGGVAQTAHFVVDEASHRAFFRDALVVERVDVKGLEALAPHAFPELVFIGGVWDGLRHFEGGYARVKEDLHHLLALLDEHGAWVFTDETGRLSRDEPEPGVTERKPVAVSNQLIQRRFKRWGFKLTPEKPSVREDRKTREPRERELGGQTLYCEWHYKFEKHINRVHIHPPIPASGGRVIVAIFSYHLP